MPSRLSAPKFVPLEQSRPNLAPLTRFKPLTSDDNGVTNSPQAAGTDLITRSVNDVGQINGIGGNVNFTA